MSVATLFALGCCSLQASCDSERAHGGAPRAAPAVSTRLPGGAGGWPAPSAAIVPKEQYTIEEKRCNPNDADCLPEPYNLSEDMIVGTVTGPPYKYRASNKRHPM
jgi:hypothetical protein